jgi:Holliday junction resolvase RusA-like endonuclease
LERSKVTIEIQDLPKTVNAMGKASIWYAQAERKKWRNEVMAAVVQKPYQEREHLPLKRAAVTLTRCSSSEPDIDNLYASFKFVIDGLVHAGVIVDDKPSVIDLKCAWRKAKPKEGKIIIQVEAA